MADESEDKKSEIALEEERVLNFWEEKEIFKRSLEKASPKGSFVFYDGPPFATGLPHYGHILAGTIKDVIPRFRTMQGYFVRRVWGWDCHGLPIENLVEKELGLNNKKEIEDYGIEEFNRAARESVLLYDREWKRVVPRLGRWIDMENAYKSMNPSFSESVFWSLKELHKKGLLYKGFKSMHICPRCETTLSNFEVNQGYKDIKDNTVTVKFKIKDLKPDNLDLKEKGDIYILSWTTTPWTLPGNSALAVNPEVDYVVAKKEEDLYILARSLSERVMGDGFDILKTLKGKELVGYSYEPVFDHFLNSDLHGDKEKGWKIYPAEFVTTEEGTGVVHIAPAFGSDDYELSLEYNIPFIQHVKMTGVFSDELGELAGKTVKPKDDHMATDVEIIKILAGEGRLFSKEKITHSYPHCWRCDTPLLNYATDSWFVKVTDIRKRLMEENKKVQWIPDHIGKNRFGEWLEEARDWSISRARFWGTPVPIWECAECGEYSVIGSFDEIAKDTNNSYILMRHGEADNNTEHVLSSFPDNEHYLTEKGKEQVRKSAKEILKNPPDIIITSDLLRTKETARMVADSCGLQKEHIIEDERLREVDFGDLNLHSVDEYRALFDDWTEMFERSIPGGESFLDIKKRLGSFLDELEMKYAGKRIMIVSHNAVLWLLNCVATSADRKTSVQMRGDKSQDFMENAEVYELSAKILPRNENYEIDVHRPYIDDVELVCSCGGKMKRVPDVFDTWYDSGSVPYAQVHYPFEAKEQFEKKDSPYFPADFIAEGQDQTRGWFYTLLVLSTAIFDRSAFKTVVVNGTVLAEDGKKMSKRLKNYPDPMDVVDRYGADAMRYALLSSPVVKAEDLAFSESRVDEISKKLTNRLMNVVNLYETYAKEREKEGDKAGKKKEIDRWIESRLSETVELVTQGLERYEINIAARPLMDFVDDLSTWYTRRSRDRFKSEGPDLERCLQTTREVLRGYSLLLAPFMPFTAERVFEVVRSKDDPESVHLSSWPEGSEVDREVLEHFKEIREIVSQALERRSEAGIRVRQPLSKLFLKDVSEKILEKEDLLEHILSEVNVKDVLHDPEMDTQVKLDTNLNQELIKEGEIRDLVRSLQSLRKKEGLTSQQSVDIIVETDDEGEALLAEASEYLYEKVKVSSIKYAKISDPYSFSINDKEFAVELKCL
ncbi:MAG: class I tRNA ligase family protein [Patescibacteria group bacterium]